MTQKNIFYVILVLCLVSFLQFNYGAIPSAERAALIAFYNATQGTGWLGQTGWKDEPLASDGFANPGTEGNWYGITVTNDHVTEIKLGGNNLKGTIPTVLTNFSNLKVLNLNGNQLSGTIPTQLANLTQLESLHLYGNSLSGSIPSELEKLKNLTILLLNKNKLTGAIPSQLGNLSQLIGLYLSENQLSGSIPVSLGNLNQLKSLNLSKNRFSGSIPSQFGNLRNIVIMTLSNNQFSGSIPSSLGNLANLKEFNITNNTLSGSIPASFTQLTNLYYLLMDHNALSGEIPSGMSNLKNIIGLDIGYNCLTTTNSTLRNWLDKKDPDWQAHQDNCSAPSSVTISLDRTELIFSATTGGSSSALQTIYIDKSGPGTLNWKATSDSSWLLVAPNAGTDTSTLYIGVNATDLAAGTYTGTVSVSASNATNSPRTISVYLTVYSQGSTAMPFGELSTPINGTTSYNSIPVTGWVLDDVGVSNVKIYNGEDYIGEAVFVEGARPDVQIAYPTYPNNSKAGWGYMLLTHFLPGGGNGVYTISAKAVDIEGNEVLLGSTTITIDNAHTVKPFGAIDTPTQGGTASGKDFVNYGWALTPLPNTIPTNGSTINIVVDGVTLGHPTYNVFRSDIASLFPGYNNTNGPIGYFYINTTTLKNGVHTISWNVTDNAGNSDGTGSRYFSVTNNSSSCVSPSETELFPLTNEITDITAIPTDECPVMVHLNRNKQTTPCPVEINENNQHVLHIHELERIEVNLFQDNSQASTSVLSGYLQVGNKLQALPIGSTLDRENGKFYWQPGPGFIGQYQLLFLEKDQAGFYTKKTVVVNIKPQTNE